MPPRPGALHPTQRVLSKGRTLTPFPAGPFPPRLSVVFHSPASAGKAHVLPSLLSSPPDSESSISLTHSLTLPRMPRALEACGPPTQLRPSLASTPLNGRQQRARSHSAGAPGGATPKCFFFHFLRIIPPALVCVSIQRASHGAQAAPINTCGFHVFITDACLDRASTVSPASIFMPLSVYSIYLYFNMTDFFF